MKAIYLFNFHKIYFSKDFGIRLAQQTDEGFLGLFLAAFRVDRAVLWLVLIFNLLAGQQIYAQDTLFLKNGGLRLVTDITITGTQLKFYNYNETGGPLYVVSKYDYQKIAFSGGNITYLSDYQIPVQIIPEESEPTDYSFGRHVLSINLVDLIYRSLTVNYEFFTPLRNLSTRVPVSIGLNPRQLSGYGKSLRYRGIQVNYPVNKIYSLGVDLSYYPEKLSKVRFFTGLGLEIGQYYEYYENYNIYGYDDLWKKTSFAVLANSGAIFHLTKRLVLTGSLGFGVIAPIGFYIRYGIAIGTGFKNNNHENKQK